METVDLQHSLVRRRRSGADERLAIAAASAAIVGFLGGAVALFWGAIGAQAYVVTAALSLAVFGATIVRLR